MVYKVPKLAPASILATDRRGRVKGRYCKACGSFFSLYSGRHQGKPMLGKDHVASPCTHEGEPFEEGDSWWEPAAEVLEAPAAE
jgi:hypothetical protein